MELVEFLLKDKKRLYTFFILVSIIGGGGQYMLLYSENQRFEFDLIIIPPFLIFVIGVILLLNEIIKNTKIKK